MQSPTLQTYFRVDIVIKNLNDPTDSKTLKFTNRPATELSTTYLPLLQSFSGLGVSLGQDGMPAQSSGTVVISDGWESYGKNRRVFDLFDRYTAHEQTVTLYSATVALGEAVPTSWTQRWQGVVKAVAKGRDTLSFSVATNRIALNYLGMRIAEDMAPSGKVVSSQSLGKMLPLLFAPGTGDYIVTPAYPLSFDEDDNTSGRYAFGAELDSTHVYDSSDFDVYMRDSEGDYRLIGAVGGSSIDFSIPGGANYPTSHGLSEFLVPANLSAFEPAICGAKWYCKGQNNGGITPVGKIIFTLYRCPGTAVAAGMQAWEELEVAEVDKADYLTQVRGASDFTVEVGFQNVFATGGAGFGNSRASESYIYGVGVKLSNYDTSTTDFTSGGVPSASGTYFYRSGADSWADGSGARPAVGVHTVGFSKGATSTNTITGYRAAYVDTNPSIVGANLQELDLAIAISGLETSGTPVTSPNGVIDIVLKDWNGSAWVSSSILDTSEYSSLYSIFTSLNFPRYVTGSTEGEVTKEEFVARVIKEMACALVPLTNGKLAVWPWGATQSTVKDFNDSNVLAVGDFTYEDTSSVINRITIGYGKNYLNINDQWEASGQATNLSNVIVANKDASGYWSFLLANSESLYGPRELEQTESQLIGDAATAQTYADYYARRFDHPHMLTTITVEYEDNQSLRVTDCVTLSTVQGPAYFGTETNAPNPTLDGDVLDVNRGDRLDRAQRRKYQIIGITNDYDGTASALVLTLRELSPRHKNDPTVTQV